MKAEPLVFQRVPTRSGERRLDSYGQEDTPGFRVLDLFVADLPGGGWLYTNSKGALAFVPSPKRAPSPKGAPSPKRAHKPTVGGGETRESGPGPGS